LVPRVTADTSGYTLAPPADFVLPFDLPALGLRGRIARLDAALTRAMRAHPLPESSALVLAEAVVLSTLLGSALKLEGRLSVQLKGDGPLSMLVSDYFAGGGVRGFARFDEAKAQGLSPHPAFTELAGKGALAITLEAHPGAQPYQGLVPLLPEGLAVSAQGYFDQSEQLPTLIKLAAGSTYSAGEGAGWRAGGIMVQAVPERASGPVAESDDWQRIRMFLDTLEPVELLDTDVKAEAVLWCLFHEDEIRVQPSQPLHFQCTCSADKVLPVLKSYPLSELKGLADADNVIRTRCEFCGTEYALPLSSLSER
jgi:molecular chaperone Hsp33